MKDFLSRRDKMILAAIEIIDEKGFQGLSTKGLAKKQGMAESLLYKHFKSKDDVVVAVVEYFARFDNAIINTSLQKDLSTKEKIIYFLNAFAEYYENYPPITAIINSYEVLKNDASTQKMIIEIIDNRISSLEKLIAEAQTNSEIGTSLPAYDISVMLWGYITKMILLWRIKGQSFSLKESILSTVKCLLERF